MTVATFIVAQAATLLGVVCVWTGLVAAREHSEGLGALSAFSGLACLVAVIAAAMLAFYS